VGVSTPATNASYSFSTLRCSNARLARAVGRRVEREQHDAGRVPVDPVHDIDPPAALALEPLLQAVRGGLTERCDDRLA
jgi:hypothetical protein